LDGCRIGHADRRGANGACNSAAHRSCARVSHERLLGSIL
jgi:hypothetical protein